MLALALHVEQNCFALYRQAHSCDGHVANDLSSHHIVSGTPQIKSDASEIEQLKALVADLSEKDKAKSAKIVNLKKTIEAMHTQVRVKRVHKRVA